MNRFKLINLIKSNFNAEGKRFEIKAAENGEATIYLYDVIDSWFGIGAESFAKALSEVDANRIHLRINSPGGDVFDGRAIYTALKQHPAEIIAHVDGLAASAATYVALAADHVEMTDGAMFMIHKGWTMAVGNADEMRKTASLLDQIDVSIVKDYVKKTGLESEQLMAWMAEEKWMDAEEAKSLGFVDSVFDGETVSNRFDLSAYDNAPKNLNKPEPEDIPMRPAFNARTPFYNRLTELIS